MPIIIGSFSLPMSTMSPRPRFRPIFCLGAVLALHLALIGMFLGKPSVVSNPEARATIVWLVPDKPPVLKPIARRRIKSSPSRSTTVASELTFVVPAIVPAIAPPPQAPTLDLEALRQQAVREALKADGPSLPPQSGTVVANHSLEARIEAAAKRAEHSDCRTAHSGAGLFAPLMIGADLIRDKGCRF